MNKKICITAGLALAATPLMAAPGAGGNAASGERAFAQRCAACHNLEAGANKIGPHLQGIKDRRAGSVSGYAYSPVMRASGLTFDAATLDAFLANPRRKVPGTKMAFAVNDPKMRADLIAYLLKR